jgi:hypothetical protein
MKKIEISVSDEGKINIGYEGFVPYEVVGLLSMVSDDLLRGNFDSRARVAAKIYALNLLETLKIDESDGLSPEWNERINVEISKIKGEK